MFIICFVSTCFIIAYSVASLRRFTVSLCEVVSGLGRRGGVVWVGVVFVGSENGVRKVGKMVLGYGRSAKLNFRAYRNPFRFLAKKWVFSKNAEIEGLV